MLNKNDLQVFEEMPTGWKKSTLEKVLPISYGKGLPKARRDNSGAIAVYGSSGEVGSHSEALTVKPSLIIGRKGSVGEVYYSVKPCWPIDTVYFVEETTGLSLKFFEYILKGLQLKRLDKSTAVPGLSRDDYNAVEVAVAPFNEQKRIVAEIEKQFSRLDEAVANLKRVKANLKRYKAAVLKSAVEGKLTEEWRKQHPDVVPADKLLERILVERREKWQGRGKYKEPVSPDTTDLSDLPEGWVWTKSDQLFSFVTSGSRGWAKYYSESGSIFLRMGNLDHDTITLDLADIQRVDPPLNSEGTRTRVTAGDILISITADVGMIGLVPDGFEEAYINQHVSLARPVRLDCSAFIAWFLACKSGQDQFRSLQRGATKVGLGLDDIKAVNMPLPPLLEQRAILTEIDRHLSVIDGTDFQVDVNLRRADHLRQSILKEAFSGNLIG